MATRRLAGAVCATWRPSRCWLRSAVEMGSSPSAGGADARRLHAHPSAFIPVRASIIRGRGRRVCHGGRIGGRRYGRDLSRGVRNASRVGLLRRRRGRCSRVGDGVPILPVCIDGTGGELPIRRGRLVTRQAPDHGATLGTDPGCCRGRSPGRAGTARAGAGAPDGGRLRRGSNPATTAGQADTRPETAAPGVRPRPVRHLHIGPGGLAPRACKPRWATADELAGHGVTIQGRDSVRTATDGGLDYLHTHPDHFLPSNEYGFCMLWAPGSKVVGSVW